MDTSAEKTAPSSAEVAAKRYLPWVVATALFMEQLDSTIVNTAIPSMAESLQVTPLSLKAVVTSYVLSLAVAIPVSGWMADRFGTRRVFMSAITIFTIASILCGLSVNSPMLVASRLLQGFGAAMMMPVGRLAIVRTFPKSELLAAMNFVIIPALIGPLLGPTVGGLIVHWMTWREIFFVNVPVGIAALYLANKHMPDYRSEDVRPLDFIGLVLFGTGVALLSWLLEVFGEHRLDFTSMAVLMLIAVSLLAAYVWHAREAAYPLLRLTLFKVRTFRVSVMGGFITRIGVGGLPFLFVRLGVKTMLAVGMAAWVVRYVLFAFGDAGGGFSLLVIGIVLHGICYDFFFVTGQIYTDAHAGPAARSSAQGFITLATYGVGMLIGTFLSGAVVEHYTTAAGPDWQRIWLFPAGVALVVLIAFLLLFRDRPVVAAAPSTP